MPFIRLKKFPSIPSLLSIFILKEEWYIFWNFSALLWYIMLTDFFNVCFVHLLWFLDSDIKWNHVVFVFLWLISLSIIPSRFIHAVANGKISFLLWLSNIFHCIVYVPHLLYPFVYCWALGLLQCCNEHRDAYIFWN